MLVRWQLLQIADSAFPTGGFAHSGGLEAAVQHGRARTADDLCAYVGEHLWNVGWASLPFVTAAFDAPHEVWALDAWNDASITSHVANRASRTQGRTFLATCARIFDDPLHHCVLALSARARTRQVSAHFAPVFGAVLAALGASRLEVQALHLHLALRGVTSAAVRLGLAGPHEAQRLQRSHGPTLDAVLAACGSLAPDEAATAFPLLDMMGATHDRLYARLFQS
jgi:urease accessory protein